MAVCLAGLASGSASSGAEALRILDDPNRVDLVRIGGPSWVVANVRYD